MVKKIAVFALVVALCLVIASSAPVVEETEIQEPSRGARHRRVTCDLLSASVKGFQANHSACAAHCLFQKYKGGYCEKGVCHCRR